MTGCRLTLGRLSSRSGASALVVRLDRWGRTAHATFRYRGGGTSSSTRTGSQSKQVTPASRKTRRTLGVTTIHG